MVGVVGPFGRVAVFGQPVADAVVGVAFVELGGDRQAVQFVIAVAGCQSAPSES